MGKRSERNGYHTTNGQAMDVYVTKNGTHQEGPLCRISNQGKDTEDRLQSWSMGTNGGQNQGHRQHSPYQRQTICLSNTKLFGQPDSQLSGNKTEDGEYVQNRPPPTRTNVGYSSDRFDN